MIRKICFYLLIISFCNYIGCYSASLTEKEILYTDIDKQEISDITIITDEDERIIIYEKFYQIINDTLIAKGMKRNPDNFFLSDTFDVKLALEDINYVEIEEPDDLATAGCLISSAGLIFLIVAVIALGNSADKAPEKCEEEGFNG